ncbi:MAG: hypothetical protein GY844_15400 [Bradyrhizobium sp.]|nr:hypothetical protein [Bradyrhizobium sp.]
MRGARAGILAVVAVLVLAATGFAQEKLQVIYGLSIPDRVGSLVYGRTIDFEAKSPGLGYALRFGGKPGWMVDVYLYDLGQRTIPADAESAVIRNQLMQARGDVFELGKRGTYADVTDKGDFTVPSTGKPRFICSSFSYLRGERVDIDVESYLCLSSWNNKFVKVRMTAPKGTMSRSDATDFVQAWIELLR